VRVLDGGTPTDKSHSLLLTYFSHRRNYLNSSTTYLQSVTIVNFFPTSLTPIVRWSTTVTYNLYSGRRLIDGAVVSVFRITGVWCAYQGSASQIGVPYAHVRCTYRY